MISMLLLIERFFSSLIVFFLPYFCNLNLSLSIGNLFILCIYYKLVRYILGLGICPYPPFHLFSRMFLQQSLVRGLRLQTLCFAPKISRLPGFVTAQISIFSNILILYHVYYPPKGRNQRQNLTQIPQLCVVVCHFSINLNIRYNLKHCSREEGEFREASLQKDMVGM